MLTLRRRKFFMKLIMVSEVVKGHIRTIYYLAKFLFSTFIYQMILRIISSNINIMKIFLKIIITLLIIYCKDYLKALRILIQTSLTFIYVNTRTV